MPEGRVERQPQAVPLKAVLQQESPLREGASARGAGSGECRAEGPEIWRFVSVGAGWVAGSRRGEGVSGNGMEGLPDPSEQRAVPRWNRNRRRTDRRPDAPRAVVRTIIGLGADPLNPDARRSPGIGDVRVLDDPDGQTGPETQGVGGRT